MPQKTNSFEKFWKELKRRKVIHVIAVYAAVAFVILQLVDIVEQPLRLPDWTTALAIVLICIGFIIAILLSWVYDITPAGVKKTKPVGAVRHLETVIPTSSGWKIATYFSGVIIVALIAFDFIGRRNLNADISRLEKSIAVLPFINDSPSDSNQYFINGIMEEILNNLQKIKDFRVLSRTSTDQYKSQDRPTIPEIAKRLNVHYVLEGSGQKYGNKFVLRVQLIAGKNERHLWAKSYNREIQQATDIINVQSEIAQLIADELKATITPEEKQLIEKTPTKNLTAYDFYQRGREEHQKYWLDTKNLLSLEKANQLYKRALEQDSKFALAYTGLAWVYWDKHFYEKYFSKEFMDSVLILCDLALSYDNQLPEAHDIKGRYYSSIDKPELALREYDKAIILNPNDWMAYSGKGNLHYSYDNDFLNAIDNYQKAITLYRGSFLPVIFTQTSYAYLSAGFIQEAKNFSLKAFQLNEDSLGYYYLLSDIEQASGNYENSINYLRKSFAMDPGNINVLFGLGADYLYLRQQKEALKYFKMCIDKNLSMEASIFQSGYYNSFLWAYLQNGDKEKAELYFTKVIESTNKQTSLGRTPKFQSEKYMDLAMVYAQKGEKKAAFKYLGLYNQLRKISIWDTQIRNDPRFDNIRNEPEFQHIVNDIEAKYQAEHDRVRKWLEETGQL